MQVNVYHSYDKMDTRRYRCYKIVTMGHQCREITTTGHQCQRIANKSFMCSWHYNMRYAPQKIKSTKKSKSEIQDFLTSFILFLFFGPFHLLYLVFRR